MAKYIDAEEIRAQCPEEYDYQSWCDWVDSLEDSCAADVRENVRGKWILHGSEKYECSNCHQHLREYDAFDCPQCGCQIRVGTRETRLMQFAPDGGH